MTWQTMEKNFDIMITILSLLIKLKDNNKNQPSKYDHRTTDRKITIHFCSFKLFPLSYLLPKLWDPNILWNGCYLIKSDERPFCWDVSAFKCRWKPSCQSLSRKDVSSEPECTWTDLLLCLCHNLTNSITNIKQRNNVKMRLWCVLPRFFFFF